MQLAVRMEDPRVQHRLMRVPDVDTRPLLELVKARPRLRVVLLNSMATLQERDLRALAANERIWFDIAMREGVGGVGRLLQAVPVSRLLFGSHLPLFSLESAVSKIREAGLAEAQRQAVCRGNAERLLNGVA